MYYFFKYYRDMKGCKKFLQDSKDLIYNICSKYIVDMTILLCRHNIYKIILFKNFIFIKRSKTK